MKRLSVKQNPANEVPTEVLADSIKSISAGVKRLRAGRLNDNALLLLIHQSAPSVGPKNRRKRVSIADIRAVLAGMEQLESTFLRKPKS